MTVGKTVIVIPARLGSTRLPNKPLAIICGEPMIVHVWRRAIESDVGPTLVAADSEEICTVIRELGGIAILTDINHKTGSDRIAEALDKFDSKAAYDFVINLQGDLPTICPRGISRSAEILCDPLVDIGTLCAPIYDESEINNPNVVKVAGTRIRSDLIRALYFTRANVPWGGGPAFHHIGIYAYKRAALKKFLALPQSDLELRESLEQLRALENGMLIDAAIVNDLPLGVDTYDDLERARSIISNRG